MENSKQQIVKASVWYTVCSLLTSGIGLLTTPIFTRMLSTSGYGDFANFESWLGIITIVITLNLQDSIIRAKYDYEKHYHEYISSMIILSSVSVIIWYIIVAIFMPYFERFFAMDSFYINLIFVYLLVYPAYMIFQAVQRFEYHYKASVALSVIDIFITIALSVFLVYALPDRLLGRILGYILPTLVISLGLYFYLWKKSNFRIIFSSWKYALKFSVPLVPHLLSMYLLSNIDRIMIKRICGSEDAGLYSLAYTVGLIVLVLLNAMNRAFSPWLGQQLHQKEHDSIRKVSRSYILLFVFVAVGLMLVTPEVLMIMGGPSYMAAKAVMPPVMLACVFQFLYNMYATVEQYEKKTSGMAVATLCAALINIALNSWLIPQYGYVAAAYTTVISYLLLFIFHYVLVYRMGLHHIFDTRMVVLVILGVSLFTLAVYFLYAHNWLRYMVIAAYAAGILVIALKNYKTILLLFKKEEKS